MATVKENLNTSELHPTLRPTVHHHRDVFNDVKPSVAELPMSSAALWQQKEFGSFPYRSSRSNVNAGANVGNALPFESSPIPVFCVKNTATNNNCYLRQEPISQGEQVSNNENCLEMKQDRVIQSSKMKEMGSDQSLVYFLMSENAGDLDTKYVDIKPLCRNTLSSGEIINEDSSLGDAIMKDFKMLHQEQKQSYSMLSDAIITNVDMNATMHCTRTDEIDCTGIKTEYSDELVTGQSERAVDQLDIKTEYSDELVSGQSETAVDQLDIKTEYSDELVSGQSETAVDQLDLKTEYSDELVSGQSERTVDQLDIKTEYSDELVSGESERAVGHLDTMSFGDKNFGKIEVVDSIITDCDCNYMTSKASAFPQHLSTCKEPQLDNKVYHRDSYISDLGISKQHRTRSRQTECSKDDDAQTMSVKDIHACPLCKLDFSCNQYLESHVKRRHHEKHWRNLTYSILKKSLVMGVNCGEDVSRTLSKSVKKALKCIKCDKTFSRSCSLNSHMRTHTTEKPFKCNECCKTFSLRGHLLSHMRTHTSNSNVLSSHLHNHMRTHRREKPFKCNECGKTFSHSNSLHTHMRTHTGEKPFVCNECGKTFSQSGRLHTHMTRHTGEKPFKCKECGKMFSQSSSLRTHMRTHTGEIPLKCNHCDKTFGRSSNLHRHMRTHTGEKPFKCNECGKAFSQSNNLHGHMRTHTGEKPFKCNECGKAFSQSFNLHGHMRTHTGEKPFKCKECGKTFRQSAFVHAHMRTHTGEKPFKCNECGKTCGQSGDLRRHMRTHTGDKPSNVKSVVRRFVRVVTSMNT